VGKRNCEFFGRVSASTKKHLKDYAVQKRKHGAPKRYGMAEALEDIIQERIRRQGKTARELEARHA
jgi:hypothetical protein